MGKRIAYMLCVMIVALTACTAAVPCAFANELEVTASAPANGDATAPTSGKFWIQFSNNVAAVEANKDCVTLETVNGKKVSSKKWKVTLPDVELDFGYRQYVYLEVDGLKAGSRYRIHISKDMEAKNGYKPAQDLDIFFNTAGKGEAATTLGEPTAVDAGSGNGDGSGASGSSSSGDIASVTDTTQQGAPVVIDLTGDSGSNQQGAGLPAGAVPVVVIVTLLLIAAWGFRIWRSRRP